jgi:recombination protein RecR
VVCEQCFDLTDRSPCEICRDPRRDASLLWVVAEPADLAAIKKRGRYRGLYHVLGGAFVPIDGGGPASSRLRSSSSVCSGGVEEWFARPT